MLRKFSFPIALLCELIAINSTAQEKITFASLSEIYAYAETHSISFQNAKQQSILAKYQTIAAKLEMFNVKGQGNFMMIDNTKLNTTFLPAEIFGGPAGTFTPVTMGQKYATSFTFEPQIDLINPYAMAQVKVLKANEQLTEINNLLDKKAIHESISAAYHNILSYQWQIDIMKKSLENAQNITSIVSNKQKEGLLREQDESIATANEFLIKDKLQQLEIQLEQQYNFLKILCDIKPLTVVTISENLVYETQFPIKATGNLLQRQTEWQAKYQKAILRADKRAMLPTLGFISSFGWQENNNSNFFSANEWFNSSYIGLKITMPILPETSKVAKIRFSKINLEIAQNKANHSQLQNEINNNQLELDLQKASESLQLASNIEKLRKDIYQKNSNIHREGILSTTDLIDSFNEWLNSCLNTVAQLAISKHAKSKILINNSIQ